MQWHGHVTTRRTQYAIIAAIKEEASRETSPPSSANRTRLMCFDSKYLPPLPSWLSIRTMKTHSSPFVSAPRMIVFLEKLLEWIWSLELTHLRCFAHAYISHSACGMWLSSIWSGPFASATKNAWSSAVDFPSRGCRKRRPAKTEWTWNSYGGSSRPTGVPCGGQDRREVDKTGQRVAAQWAWGDRRNIVLNIENQFGSTRRHEGHTVEEWFNPQARRSFVLSTGFYERLPGFNIKHTHLAGDKTFQQTKMTIKSIRWPMFFFSNRIGR